jgi:hypothetical protein
MGKPSLLLEVGKRSPLAVAMAEARCKSSWERRRAPYGAAAAPARRQSSDAFRRRYCRWVSRQGPSPGS